MKTIFLCHINNIYHYISNYNNGVQEAVNKSGKLVNVTMQSLDEADKSVQVMNWNKKEDKFSGLKLNRSKIT